MGRKGKGLHMQVELLLELMALYCPVNILHRYTEGNKQPTRSASSSLISEKVKQNYVYLMLNDLEKKTQVKC